MSGSPGTPSIARARPPRNGPIWRHRIPLNNFSSIAPAGVGFGVAVGDFVGDGVWPPSFGGGLTAKVVKQMETSAAENRKRKVNVSIRLRWKACRAVQLESRKQSPFCCAHRQNIGDRKSTRLNSSHAHI